MRRIHLLAEAKTVTAAEGADGRHGHSVANARTDRTARWAQPRAQRQGGGHARDHR